MTDGQITTDEANEINSAIDDAKNKVVSLRSALNGIVNNIMSFRISSGDPGNIKCGKVVIKALSPLMFFNPDTGQQLPNSYLDNLILSLDASRPTASAIAVFISAAPASKGLGVLVDGVQHTSYSATWSKGASHNLAVTTPLSGNDGKTYSFQRWSDGNTSTSRSVTPIIDTTYTAIFTNDNASVVPLTASADATVSALNPALNYGTPPFLLVFKDGAASGRRDSLVRFGLGSIPVGSTITRVDFVLTVGSGLNPLNFFEVRKATSSWSENSVNWNNRPSIDPLALVLARADAAQITLSSTVWSGLSNVVQQWVNNPSQNHGFYLLLNAAATPDDGIGFASREDSTESKRPKLTISFRPPDDGDGDTIVNLRAKRSSSGSSIAANTWQLDNDPYFYWDAPSSVLPIVGYSFALDVQPDQTVDTTVAYHQYPSDSLSDGTHTFYVRSVDANDNWGPPASFQIKVDSVAPANGTISINNGAADTLSLIVSMNNLSASDTHSGVNQMRFSNDGGTWSDWESFAASKSNWDLSAYGGNSAPGTKTVFVQYRDSAGNVSATSADSIELLGPPATRIIGLSGDLAFGEVAVGASAQRTLTITNSGNATLNISNISYPVGFSGAWSGPIATNGSQNVTVTFTPTAVQNYGGTVVVSSDATSGINSNSASGTGLALPSAPLPIAAWGDNSFGQTNVPPGLTNVLSIAGGNWHSLAIKPGGTVVEWGFGAGGNASVSGSLLGVIAIDGGVSHSVALQANGDVFAWGANTFGQTNVPQNLTNAVAISAGDNFSVVLKRDGTVLAWGGASLDETNIPAGLRNVVAIAAGGGHGLALKQDGRVTAWGFNAFGQANVPPSLDNVVDVAAGGGHSLALKHDGTVVAWGANIDWSGNYGGQVDVPLDLTNVVAIAAGAYHSLALKCDGAVISWGNNFYGQTQAPSSLTNAVALAGGGYHSLALLGDGGPVFTVQPWDRTVVIGDATTLTAMAAGLQPLSYQWRLYGTNIPGATANTYTRTNVLFNDAGVYSVLVTNALGSVLSSNATLIVEQPAQPVVNIASLSDQTIQLSIETQPGKLYWIQASTNLIDWTAVHGATGDGAVLQYTDAIVNTSSRRFYRVLVFPSEITGPHPADLNADFRLTSNEAAAYGSAFQTQADWPISPSPILIEYYTRAVYLSSQGEWYHTDPSQPAPLCWVLGQQ